MPVHFKTLYLQAYKSRRSQYETASMILAKQLGEERFEVIELLKAKNISLLGRDRFFDSSHAEKASLAWQNQTPEEQAESNRKRSLAHLAYGDHHPSRTKEARLKISQAKLGRPRPDLAEFNRRPETRLKRSASFSSRAWKQTTPEALLLSRLDKRRFKYTGILPASHFGTPISADILAPALKLIIQVDGCFWHECPLHGSGRYPGKQVADATKTKYAEEQGWVVLRFWEHEIYHELDVVLAKIKTAIIKQLEVVYATSAV